MVGGGIESVPGIIKAQELGLKVVVSDSNKNAPGKKVADYFIHASTYDVETTKKTACEFSKNIEEIGGVICLGTDVPHTVAAVSRELSLYSQSEETAKIAIDKVLMKNCFSVGGVNIPAYMECISYNDINKFITTNNSPWIIKPADSRGARGVSRVTNKKELATAFKHALNNSPTKRAIIEQYIQGPQYSTESLIVNGMCYTLGYANRNYEFLERFAPYIIENGGELPASIDTDTKKKIDIQLNKIAKCLNLKNGILKGDIVSNNGEIFVIEVATRLSGGYFCTHEIPLNTGIDFVGLAIKQAMGEKISVENLKPKYDMPVVQRYLFPDYGTVKEIIVPDWINKDEEIKLFEIRVSPGQKIEPIDSHPARAGVIIASGKNMKSLIKKVNKAVSSIQIIVS